MTRFLHERINLAKFELLLYIYEYRRLIIIGDIVKITKFEKELEGKFVAYEKLLKDSNYD